MNTALARFFCFLAAFGLARSEDSPGQIATSFDGHEGRVVVDIKGTPPPPLIFSAAVNQSFKISPHEIAGEATASLQIAQGKPDTVSLSWFGAGEILSVSGTALRDWAVRTDAAKLGHRWLDLHFLDRPAGPATVDVTIRTQQREPALPGNSSLLVFGPGAALGFSSRVTVTAETGLAFQIVTARGFTRIQRGDAAVSPEEFLSSGEGELEVALSQSAALAPEIEISDARLAGTVDDTRRSAAFVFKSQLRAARAGLRVRVLTGRAGLLELARGDGWHCEPEQFPDGDSAYDVVSDRAGTFPVELKFAAEIIEHGDWRTFDFALPASAVTALQFDGVAADSNFKADAPVVPVFRDGKWQAHLPADGSVAMAWRTISQIADAALFFSSSERTDVRVEAGMIQSTSEITFKVLQGKMAEITAHLRGEGDIVAVEGNDVTGWKIASDRDGKLLRVQLSQPIEREEKLRVRAQTSLGAFPTRTEPLRIFPQGAVRHDGSLRVASFGAVKIEVVDTAGLMQLSPEQVGAATSERGLREVLAYRFPNADYSYHVVANRIQPEVSVSEVAVYRMSETDRIVDDDLELEIREAPLHDWTIAIPEDYAVAEVTGANVADYVAESAVGHGRRKLKVIFNRALDGRQLVHLRLEKNQSAGAGEWTLPRLQFLEAKDVRGQIAIASAAGFRAASVQTDQLTEVPASYFPNQISGLQQAWRARDRDWSAVVHWESRGQAIQADVFHLYSVNTGVVSASILINYFVVGAPATEWRLRAPASLGNLNVIGQNVRRDWHREGDQIVVSLHQPVLGPATLLLTYQLPLDARGGAIQPGEIEPLGVQSERGYVELVSAFQIKQHVQSAEGLLTIDALELPTEYRLLTSAPALAIYQYTARPFNCQIELQPYASADLADQAVDYAKLVSRVSREGEIVTAAEYYVKSRGQQSLRFTLPTGVSLWETRVDGQVANARIDRSEILVPLAAHPNINEPIHVALQVGQSRGVDSRHLTLAAPRLAAPDVVAEWLVQADAGQLLVPEGGSAELVRANLTETGFEWISTRVRFEALALFGLSTLAVFVLQRGRGWLIGLGVVLAAVAIAWAGSLMAEARFTHRANSPESEYTAHLVGAETNLNLHVANVSAARAMFSELGVGIGLAGAVLLGFAIWRRRAPQSLNVSSLAGVVGASAMCGGLLVQRGSAPTFFGAIAAGLFVLVAIALVRWAKESRRSTDEPPSTTLAGVAPMLIGLGVLGLVAPFQSARAEDALVSTPALQNLRSADALVQTWSVHDHRVLAEADITISGKVGESFMLLESTAALTSFVGDGLQVQKIERDGRASYYVSPTRDGLSHAHFRYEMPIAPGVTLVSIPTGLAAAQRITVDMDQSGWAISSPAAVEVAPVPDSPSQHSTATLVLRPMAGEQLAIQLQPKQRDPASEKTEFFAELATLVIPSAGNVSSTTAVNVRIAQGRVAEMEVDIPAGWTVADVRQGPVASWRFDPQRKHLHLVLEPAQTGAFRFEIETQRSAAALPYDLAIEPLRVQNAAEEVGKLALAFPPDTQPENFQIQKVSPIAAQDFNDDFSAWTHEPAPKVAQVWRYGREGGSVNLRVTAVLPEIRVENRNLFSIDDDRLVLSCELRTEISRAGVFQLSFEVPSGLDIETISGPALRSWSESKIGEARIVTLQLKTRTLGAQTFAVTLSGPAPHGTSWAVPQVTVREATRQIGDTLIVPGKGLQLRTIDRVHASAVDPRQLGALQPGTLAFHQLENHWCVTISVTQMEPWMSVQSLQEETVREGQSLTRLTVHEVIENAAVKSLRVHLPDLNDERARTLRATGTAVKDLQRVAGADKVWEIRFAHPVSGAVDFELEDQGSANALTDTIFPPEFLGARQVEHYIALRAGGRVELQPGELPEGWTRCDWTSVPATLATRADPAAPAFCYRAPTSAALPVEIRRHEIAEGLKLRVKEATLVTVVAPHGNLLTSIAMKLEVLSKHAFRVEIPTSAQVFGAWVNGRATDVVRDGDGYLFTVEPTSAAEASAAVRFVYLEAVSNAGNEIALSAPRLNTPWQNVTWRVVLPKTYLLRNYSGALRLVEQHESSGFNVADYRVREQSAQDAQSESAVNWLKAAGELLQQGDQQKAGELLGLVSSAAGLDEASNEDARVQLRNLKTQQTLLGLTTRRERLYFDHRAEGERNESLEQAAMINPYIQGKANFDPQELDQLLMGNTEEETVALKDIAGCIVDQQLAARPTTTAIDVTIPERGRVLTFARSLQVDTSAPLMLQLSLRTAAPGNSLFATFVIVACGAAAWFAFRPGTIDLHALVRSANRA